MLVDVVSDLHVDYWSDFVYDWKKINGRVR